MNDCTIRPARKGDEPGAYYVCLKTGDYGKDGEPFYREDPDALGRIFVGPYLAYEPELSLILEDQEGICGYALGAFDSRAFFARYEAEWRPDLCARFPEPQGDRRNGRVPNTFIPGIITPITLYRSLTTTILLICTLTCCSARVGAVMAVGCWNR